MSAIDTNLTTNSYKMLTVLDEYTRRVMCVAVKTRMGSVDVLEAIYPLLLKLGKPEYIRSDNGSEFIAKALQEWLTRVGKSSQTQDHGTH